MGLATVSTAWLVMDAECDCWSASIKRPLLAEFLDSKPTLSSEVPRFTVRLLDVEADTGAADWRSREAVRIGLGSPAC